MNNCKEQEWIDSYLLGELNDDEHRRFETRYTSDEAFRTEVDLQAAIMVGINNHYAAEPKVVKHPASNHLWIKSALRVAATVALVIMAGLMIQNAEDNTMIAEDNKDEQTISKLCNTETFHTSSAILAMVDLNQLCCFPVSAL